MSETVLTAADREMLEQTPVGRAALAEIRRLDDYRQMLRAWLATKQDRIQYLETELAKVRR